MKKLFAATALMAGLVVSAQAATIGYYLSDTSGSPAAAITAAGHTPVQLANLTAVDLAGINVLWILNGNNNAPNATVLNNQGAISAFVSGGGVLSFHDRAVTDAATYIPGAGGVSFFRDFNPSDNIDVLVNNTVTNGPGGVIGNTTLDGGNASNHGYASLGTLPAGAVGVLNVGGALDEIVDFYYAFGAGDVYYSTMPLDFYLAGSGNNPPRDSFNTIYAVNEAAFQAELWRGNQQIPVPSTLLLVSIGLFALSRRRRSA